MTKRSYSGFLSAIMLDFDLPKQFDTFDENLLLGYLEIAIKLNHNRLNLILSKYPSLNQAVQDNFFEIRKLPKTNWLDNFEPQKLTTDFQKFTESVTTNKIHLCSIFSKNYPIQFQNLPDKPLVIYYQGSWQALEQKKMITVVGSRNPTVYAKKLINQILEPLCGLGIGVVSGLAFGIDTLAHQKAVEKDCTTIGVIGSGLDENSFYPKENQSLKTQIIQKGGLILSEYAPGTPPNAYNFPQRNRLLAALGDLVWVVQAGIKSGSLITANLAQEMGKTVATTPSSIYDEAMLGNLKLLKDGANFVSEPEDILQLLGLAVHRPIVLNQEIQFNNDIEKLVWQQLSVEPQLLEDISEKLNMDIHELSQHLTMLELQNLAICVGENMWIRG